MEYKGVTPEEIIRDLESRLMKEREDKYAFQVGLKDLDFEVDDDKLEKLRISLPFHNIGLAEEALMSRIITPTKLVEHDGTEHRVIAFDPRPVGFSGFMDCVNHSLVLTDQGLFNIGRYPAVNLTGQSKSWGWFLHNRLANSDEISSIQALKGLTSSEVLEEVYSVFTGTK